MKIKLNYPNTRAHNERQRIYCLHTDKTFSGHKMHCNSMAHSLSVWLWSGRERIFRNRFDETKKSFEKHCAKIIDEGFSTTTDVFYLFFHYYRSKRFIKLIFTSVWVCVLLLLRMKTMPNNVKLQASYNRVQNYFPRDKQQTNMKLNFWILPFGTRTYKKSIWMEAATVSSSSCIRFTASKFVKIVFTIVLYFKTVSQNKLT